MAVNDTSKAKFSSSELNDIRQCEIIDSYGRKIRVYLLWDKEISPDESFVVTKGFDGCLFIFDHCLYMRFEEGLENLPEKKPESRMLGRFFIASAIDINFNEMCQVELPQNLLDYANIKTEAVIEGKGGFAAVWSIEAWQKGLFPNGFDDIEKIIAEY